MRRKIIFILLLILVMVVSLIILNIKQERKKEIKVGAILPLTGKDADLGEQSKRGIDLAIKKINKIDGIKGRKIKIIYEDSQGQSNLAVSSLNKLINFDKVQIIIGELSSTATIALAPIAEKNKVVLISPSASSPKLTYLGDYIFRVCASDVYEGTVMADYTYNVLKIKEIGILYINNDYGLGLKEAFSVKYHDLGGNVKISEPFESGGNDFRTQLMKIKNSKINTLYLPGYASEIGLIIRQAKEMKLNFKYLSSIDFENQRIFEIAGDLIEGTIYSAYDYNPKDDETVVKEFYDSYKFSFDDEPSIYTALSYDSVLVISKALESGFSSEKIKQALYNIKRFKGVTGEISFDENGDVMQSIVMKIYKNKTYQFLNK